MIFVELSMNFALLLALCMAYSYLSRRWTQKTVNWQIFTGLAFGGAAILGMLTPLNFIPGVIFDGRSIPISIAGLLGGPIPAAISAIIASVYRLALGGPGALTGCGVIVTSAAIGVGYYYLRERNTTEIKNSALILFGIVVHIAMLLWMLTLPGDIRWDVLRSITIPVLLIYPVGTLLVGRLLMDQNVLRATEIELQESEKKYRSVIEHSSDAIYLLFENRFELINSEFTKLFGVTLDEVSDQNFDFMTLVAPKSRPLIEGRMKKMVEGQDISSRYEFTALDKNGNEIEVEAAVTHVSYRDGAAAQGILRDVTERKKGERREVHLNTVLRAIRNVNQLIVQEKDRSRLAQGICNSLVETRGFTRAWIALFDEDGNFLTAGEAGIGERFTAMIDRLKKGVLPICGTRALVQSGVLVIEDHPSFCIGCPISGEDRCGNTAVIRLEHDQKVYGLMFTEFPAELSIDEEEQSLFGEVAGDISFALHGIEIEEERERVEKRARRLLKQQTTVNQLTLALGETSDLDMIYHTIYQHIGAMVDAWGFIISSYDNETQLIRAEYLIYQGTVLDVAGFPPIPLTEPGQGGQSQVIHTGEPKNDPDHRKSREDGRPVYNVEEDGTIREGPPPEEDEDSPKSALYVPMKIEGKTIGVMQLQSRRLDAYSQEDINLLTGMANVAAVAVQNARLYDAGQQELNERKRAEEALQESEDKYRKLFELSSDALFLIEVDTGGILDLNDTALKMYGYSREEALQMKNTDFSAEPAQTRQAIADQEQQIPVRYHKKKDGTCFPTDISVAYFKWFGREVCIATIRDITERQQAEEELKQYSEKLEEMVEERTEDLHDAQEELVRKEKLATLGQLGGGVAHELRNPLGVISNAVYFLKSSLTDADDVTVEYLDMISSEISGAVQIINNLLSLTRKEEPQVKETLVAELVARGLVRRVPPEDVKVSTEISDETLLALADPSQIIQVMGNLLSNAYQAMPDGGDLTIKAWEEDNNVLISVADTGCGIPEENLEEIFEPLFTTKARGFGFGLSISRDLIGVNNGSIEVESEEGEGSTFTVILPSKDGGA